MVGLSMGKRMGRPTKQSFLHGALILLVAVAIVKVIGALFKIPLNFRITPVGMGYFSTAYNLYNPIFSLATAGFPIAIARLVSENYARGRFRDIRQIHKVSIPIFLTLGLLAFCLMFFGAKPYVSYATDSGDMNALPAIYLLSPAILFSSMVAIYRGYYEGLRNMYPTALSEVVEALFKLVLGLAGAYLVIQNGLNEYAASGTVYGIPVESVEYAKAAALPYAAAGAIFGVTVGSAFGFVFLWIYHKCNGDGITHEMLAGSPRPYPMKQTVVRLVRTAIPVALGALAVNLSSLVDTTFVQRRLRDIMSVHPEVLLQEYSGLLSEVVIQTDRVPTFLFGCYGNATTLFMLVPAITQAFGVSALPNVTTAWTTGDPKKIKNSIETVLRVVAMITIPAGLGLSVLSGPITQLLGYNEITGKILILLGLGAIFAATDTPINSMLQAVGRVDLPIKLLSVGLVIKVVLNYLLVGIPEINVMGAGIGTLVCYFFLTVFGLVLLCREAKIKLDWVGLFVKPFLSGGVCVLSAYLVQKFASVVVSSRIATVLALFVAVVVYGACMLWTRALQKSDVLMLPKGQKIAKILENHGWIR